MSKVKQYAVAILVLFFVWGAILSSDGQSPGTGMSPAEMEWDAERSEYE